MLMASASEDIEKALPLKESIIAIGGVPFSQA
jgi:hypothetical protein